MLVHPENHPDFLHRRVAMKKLFVILALFSSTAVAGDVAVGISCY